jgi:group I intron endonuclease
MTVTDSFTFLVPEEYKGSSGIYIIKVDGGSSFYVGSAVNFKRRFITHSSALRKGLHHCKPLQHAWNKYGESSFSMEILEVCVDELSNLVTMEQKWIDYFGYGNLYNTCPTAGSILGLNFTYESRVKLSESHGGTGVPGVHKYRGKDNNGWAVKVKGQYLGGFNSKEEAIEAAKKYEQTGDVGNYLHRKNTSGYTGVYYNKRAKRWVTEATIKGKRMHIGYFPTPEEANEARIKFIENFNQQLTNQVTNNGN